MNKKFKCRVWDKRSNHMLSWENLLNQYNTLTCLSFDFFVIMEYTGLRDKNGKEIYKGDIVKFKTFESFDTEKLIWVKGSVIWWDSQYCWYITGEENNCLSHIIKDGIEIIGNTYENPELLKEAK